MKKLLSLSLISLAVAGQSGNVAAYEEGDIIIRGGAAQVAPEDSASAISIDTPALGSTGIDDVRVDANTQLGVSVSYMLKPQIAIEVLAATPFSHEISTGALGGEAKLAETKHLPPTITANYHFLDAASKFQPYVGAGLNYTLFFNEETAPALEAASTYEALAAAAAGGPVGITEVSGSDIKLEDSIGFAMHVGFDYLITENLGLNASYYWIDIDTEAEITTMSNAGPVKASVDVDIDPNVYMLGLTYKF